MDQLVGTSSCPHLGFDLKDGRPCCHADDVTRSACGKFAPNPVARNAGAAAQMMGVEPYFCTVLGTDSIPAAALRLAAEEKAKARQIQTPAKPGYKPPAQPGQRDPLPSREQDVGDADPIIPTHTLRTEGRQVMPNDKCPCGSGKKYKKCCGR